ncbi:MAG: PrsW family glutamic-type intramembrane protease [Nannocystales bacterium]
MPAHRGWYPDPWNPSRWRWWDGWAWTPHLSARPKKPTVPGWLSVPVLLAALVVVPVVLVALATMPHVVLLSLAPAVIALPVMMWLDRVEPEPPSALIHSLLWGATVAILLSSIVNATVGALAGEVIASVVSAPFIEEATKAGAILYAVKRREVDSPMDGIVYAAWTAIGFAVVEDIEYFARAASEGQLAAVFILRGILAPFAHPLFTAWTGLAVGRAISRGRAVFPSILWGYALAVATHALWNASAAAPGVLGEAGVGVLLLTAAAFFVAFISVAVVLYRTRRKEEKRFCELVPWLAERYGLSPAEIAWFGDFRAMLHARKRGNHAQRRWFDRMHTALARLALLHDRPQAADPATEQALVDQLRRARTNSTS